MASSPPKSVDETKAHDMPNDVERGSLDSVPKIGDILQQEHTDPVLNAKMHLVNDVRRNPKLPIAKGTID